MRGDFRSVKNNFLEKALLFYGLRPFAEPGHDVACHTSCVSNIGLEWIELLEVVYGGSGRFGTGCVPVLHEWRGVIREAAGCVESNIGRFVGGAQGC